MKSYLVRVILTDSFRVEADTEDEAMARAKELAVDRPWNLCEDITVLDSMYVPDEDE